MPLRNFIPKHLQDTFAAPIEHVLQFFGGTSQSDSTFTPSQNNILSPTNKEIGTDAVSKPKSMSESRSPRTNKHLDRILEGYYGSEIVIEDEEEETDKGNKASKRYSLQRRPQEKDHDPRNDNRRSCYRLQSSEEEDWLLGVASKKTPSDATKIQNPMMRFREQQRSFGFRPIDTLHSSPAANSSQAEFYQQKTRGTEYQRSNTPKSQKSKSQGFLRTPPRKKQRTGSSPMEIRAAEIINLDDSQEFDITERSSIEKIHPNGSEGDKNRTKRLSSADPRLNFLEHDNAKPSRIRRVIHRYREDSPDDLMDHEFTKNAKQQRLQNTNANARQRLNGLLRRSISPDGKDDFEITEPTERDIPGTSNGVETPHQVDRMAARLAIESPDELQLDSTAHQVPARNSRIHVSGSSIVENVRKSKTPTRPQKVPHKEDLLRIPVHALVGFRLPSTNNYELVVVKSEKVLYIDYKDHVLSEDPISQRIGVEKIDRIWWPELDDFTVIALCFRGNSAPTNLRSCYIDFATTKGLRDFQMYIEGQTSVKTGRKNGEWLQSAMAKINATQDVALTDSRTTIFDGKIKDEVTSERTKEPHPKRHRLDERLDHPKKDDQSLKISDSANVKRQWSPDMDIRQPLRPIRQTRSTSNLIRGSERFPEIPRKSLPRREGPHWKNELVYPPTGRKRESVSWDDLARLEDDEFLNDNLVGLFLRYLQEHADQDRLKRMHFFSSFFFEKLTTNAEAKVNRKQINYTGVSSWTKNLNLFSRDFVIVPVNENLHWYVMIICNLPELKQQKTEEEEEISMIDAFSLPQEEAKANFSNDGGNDIEDLTADEPRSSPLLQSKRFEAARKGRRKSYKPMHRKYDVKKPIIITLDSLNIARSTTATALKQYIVEEAQSKLQLTIEQSEIQGMTAKGIPLQSNYSDCGLYVCMYIEQFMKDPYAFVRRILQREDAGLRWPKSIGSRDLRQKFYEMLQELYAAQEEKRKAVVPEIGSILVTMQPEEEAENLELVQLTADAVKSGAKFYHEYKAETQSLSHEEEDFELKDVSDVFKFDDKPMEVSDDDSRASIHQRNPSRLSTSNRSKYFDPQYLSADDHQEDHSKEIRTEDTRQRANIHSEEPREVVERQELVTVHDSEGMLVNLVDKTKAGVNVRDRSEEHAQWQGMPDEVPETPEMVIAESANGEDDDMLMKE